MACPASATMKVRATAVVTETVRDHRWAMRPAGKEMMPVFGHHARATGAMAGEALPVSAPPGVLLEARDVHKAYGSHQVLRGADLAAGPGQLVGGGGGERGREVHPAEDPRR